MLTVSTMGSANLLGFFQHQMKESFAGYLWKFSLVYVDNIVVFHQTLES